MDVDQTQELEMEALKAIYGDDFHDAPPSKVWKVRDLDISHLRSTCYLVDVSNDLYIGCCHIP